MQIHQLKRKTPNKAAKKVGRGGLRGKTSGRGHKGQKQHGGHGIRSELRDQIKKIPKLRGRGVNSNKSIHKENFVINIKTLQDNFVKGDVVSPLTLAEKGLVKGSAARKSSIKILGNGEISVSLIIEGCLLSVVASEKISKAGGKVS
jgi:large subunit ribosomal protein L15